MTTILDILRPGLYVCLPMRHVSSSVTPVFAVTAGPLPGNEAGGNEEQRGSMSLLKRKFGATQENPAASAGGQDASVDRVGGDQRIRVGLTGLAAIFLLVLVAAAGLRPGPAGPAGPTPEATGEPLAVLGVAPGAGLSTVGRDAVTSASAPSVPFTPAPRPTRG